MPSAVNGSPLTSRRLKRFLRLRYPRKLDFCRMTFDEMRAAWRRDVRKRHEPARKSRRLSWKSDTRKDLVDFDAVDALSRLYLTENDVPVNTFAGLLARELQPQS